MHRHKSNIVPGRIAEDAPGLQVVTPDTEELLRLEDTYNALLETYGILRDSLIEAVQRTRRASGRPTEAGDVIASTPFPVPIVTGTPNDLTIVQNLESASEMLKVKCERYTVLRIISS